LVSLETEYLAIFDQLKTVATTLQYNGAPAFKKIVQGWKSVVTTFPMCFILPDPNFISPSSANSDIHKFRFIVAVVVEKADVEEGLRDSIKLSSAFYDAIVIDRKLGEHADNTEITKMEFHWRTAPGFIRHWTATFVEASRFYHTT
jgi:hypothetical protein